MTTNKSSIKITQAGIGYTIGNYLIKGLSFFTIPIFSRLLSTHDYGVYSTYLAYESIMCSIIGLALHTSIKNARYKYENSYHDYLSSILLLSLLSILVWLIVGIVFLRFGSTFFDFAPYIILILIVHCGCSSILSIYNVHLSLAYAYKSYVVIAGINAVINIVTSILLIKFVFIHSRYTGRILGTVIPLLMVAGYIVVHIWKNKKPKMDISYWKFGLTYSIPLIPHAISQIILNQFDRIMISAMVGSAQAGIYSFAYNIYAILEVTKSSLDNVWAPWFYEQYKNQAFNIINQKTKLYVIGMFLFTSLTMLISPEVIQLLGPKDYYNAVYIVIPICAAGFFSFLYTIPVQVEYYHAKTSYVALGTIAAAGINICLNWVFIRKYGYYAAAYTTEVTYILYFLFHYIIAQKLSNINMFDRQVLFGTSAACIIVSMLGVVLVHYWYIRWTIALVLALILVVYGNKYLKSIVK